jgi:uncharacterized metal-binding protein YceD (DUF177 family)
MNPKKARQAEPPWSVPVRLSDIPQEGRSYRLDPDARTRAAVAEAVGVAALPRVQADLTLTRSGRDRVRVAGVVTAVVGQTCVVTLEPVETKVAEIVDLMFTAEGERSPPSMAVDLSALPNAPEPPEPLENGTVDLGRIAVEFLVLGIDLYPRKPDAKFEAPGGEPDQDAAAHPFAALRMLKKGA